MHPISYLQGIVLGLLQGIAEPFPISSLGHGVILPRALGWDIHQGDGYFLSFLVATHLATAIVLLGFFGEDWLRIARGFVRSVRAAGIPEGDTDARLAWLLIAGTLPAGVLGLGLEHNLRDLFASPQSAAAFLVVNGLLLLGFERMRRSSPATSPDVADPHERLSALRFGQSLVVGVAQAAALVPGISRSGITMGGGLLSGLTHQDAARFGFLLATPIIGAAGLLKLPDLLGSQGDGVRGPALAGAVAAAFTTYLAVRFLLRFLKTNSLAPFGVYCLVAGCAVTFAFSVT